MVKQNFIESLAPNIYAEAISTFGVANQLDVAIEEMSELIKAICKYKRGFDNINDIAEEMADVRIMLEQVELIFPDMAKKTRKERRKKLERLYRRVQKARLEECQNCE